MKLTFLVDLTKHINYFILKLQGKNNLNYDLIFRMKVGLYKNKLFLKFNNYKMF